MGPPFPPFCPRMFAPVFNNVGRLRQSANRDSPKKLSRPARQVAFREARPLLPEPLDVIGEAVDARGELVGFEFG